MNISRRERLRLHYPAIYRLYKPVSYLRWIARGRTLPPVHVFKERTIREYARRNRLSTWVETGTYLGFMVEELRRDFDRIITIELDHELFETAVARFGRYANIEILEGDSGIILREVCARLAGPALFWLDGHFQPNIGTMADGETPVLHELMTIFSHWHDDTVILIDDARLFGERPDYPPLPAVIEQIKAFDRTLSVEVRDDIIRIGSK